MNKRAKILEIVRGLSQTQGEIDPEESLFESGVLDSFTLLRVVSALEGEFSVTIPESELTPRKFDSIARIEAYLDSRIQNGH